MSAPLENAPCSRCGWFPVRETPHGKLCVDCRRWMDKIGPEGRASDRDIDWAVPPRRGKL